MKRNLVSFLCLLFLLVAASCTRDNKPEPEVTSYTAVIPADAYLVAKVQVQQLLDKSQLQADDNARNALSQMLGTLLDDNELLQLMLDDPQSCGVDWQQPLLVAVDDLQRATGVLSMAVNDTTVLGNFLRSNNLPRMRFDERKLVISLNPRLPDVTRYLSLDDSLRADLSLDYSDFFAAPQDVALYYPSSSALEASALLPDPSHQDIPELREQAIGAHGLLTLDFGLGHITLTNQIEGSPEFAAYLSRQLQANLLGQTSQHDGHTRLDLLTSLRLMLRQGDNYEAWLYVGLLDELYLDFEDRGPVQLHVGLKDKSCNALQALTSLMRDDDDNEDDDYDF